MEKHGKETKTSERRLTLNKLSFGVFVLSAILYLVAMILSLCGIKTFIVMALQNVAMLTAMFIVAVLAWRYCAKRQFVYKLLYIIVLLVVLVGIVIPLII